MAKRLKAETPSRVPGGTVMSLEPTYDERVTTGVMFKDGRKQLNDDLGLKESEPPGAGDVAPVRLGGGPIRLRLDRPEFVAGPIGDGVQRVFFERDLYSHERCLTDRGSAAGLREPPARAIEPLARLYQISESRGPVSCNRLLGRGQDG